MVAVAMRDDDKIESTEIDARRFDVLRKISGLSPVSNRMRIPFTSMSAAKPQSFFIEAFLPNASYKIVTRLADWAALRQGNRKKRMTTRPKETRDPMLPPLNAMRGIESGEKYKPPF
jgi:hypothetical protein